MVQRQAELTERWVKKNPNGNLDDNRLQLQQASKQAVFNEECKKDPTLYDKAKAIARDMKTASETFTAGDMYVRSRLCVRMFLIIIFYTEPKIRWMVPPHLAILPQQLPNTLTFASL